MPRENRKRGNKHKKSKAEEEYPQEQVQYEEQQEEVAEPQAGPSWIVSAPNTEASNEEAPFGYVDSEVKAYFRTVDVQIREWQEEPRYANAVQEDETDPNEDRRMFFMAALTEMSGKEKELATDPDCSTILERMAYSMDDFARRVFMDRLTGSYKTLVKHRFASHVCQTFLEVADETITREARGVLPPLPESSEEGELLTMTDMVPDICEELTPDFTSLMMDPFASHVCRALLSLLMPNLLPPEQKSSTLRSKRSAAYKARQGPMKSLFAQEKAAQSETTRKPLPKFRELAEKFVDVVREKLSANEVRALAASPVASPVLQILLEMEAEFGKASEPNSLADMILDGLITRVCDENGQSDELESSDYVGTLLRDATSSHLLETLVRRMPANVFEIFWSVYLKGKLGRLSAHPVANFVVAKALERTTEAQLGQACEELQPVAEKLFKSSRTGLVRAMIENATRYGPTAIEPVIEIVFQGVGLSSDDKEQRAKFVPCVLRLLSAEEYAKASTAPKKQDTGDNAHRYNRRARPEANEDPMAPKVQGALILQSMLRLPAPHNQVVLDSLYSLPMEDIITMAHDATASRVLDMILTSPTVTFKERREFVMHFIGHYHILVDDRIGSRVGDNCWAFADPYLKEKIARSLIPRERDLVASFYGKFFARNLNLYLLQRNPEQWKTLQANQKAPPKQAGEKGKKDAPTTASAPTAQDGDASTKLSKKRKAHPSDEIDQVFETLGKKVKKAELKDDVPAETKANDAKEKADKKEKKEKKRRKHDESRDKGLEDVLGAIKAAPKDEKRHHHKKKAS